MTEKLKLHFENFSKAGIRAGKRLHMDLIDALVQFPISFYDKTPTGRILNRVGKDIETVDAPLIRSLEMWTFCGFRVVFGCISICVGMISNVFYKIFKAISCSNFQY